MTGAPKSQGLLRFTATRPEIPPIDAWRPYAEEAYAANWFTNFGELSLRLERELHARWGAPEGVCVAASSGTAAIAAPLIACGIEGPVISPAFTFPATFSAIRMAGATPVLADVDAETWRIAPEALEAAFVRTGAKAAILVCPFGLRTDWSAHIEIARAHGAITVIDNAAGLGVVRAPVEIDRDVFEAFSMHATKPFGIGEGGVIFAHASREHPLRGALNFGATVYDKPGSPPWGINGKLGEMYAAIGLAVLETLEQRLEGRRKLVAGYKARLAQSELVFPRGADADASWQLLPALAVNAQRAETIVRRAREAGMEARHYYRPALSKLAAFTGVSCPVSEDLAQRMVCFPVYSNATPSEQEEMLGIAEASARGAAERA